jgi:ABC-type nitrate/sulfonate/bicarbonate transport system ATPase subunit
MSDRVAVMCKGPDSHVVAEIDIDLPRPRTLDSRRTSAFQEYVHELENILGIDQVER